MRGAPVTRPGVVGPTQQGPDAALTSWPDEALFEAVCAGSEPHFNVLYTRYFRRIYAFVYQRVRNHADAEELVQETFTVVFRGAAREDTDGGNFETARQRVTIEGPWTVEFDPAWGGPASVQFDRLIDWTTRPEDGIRHYSGSATYKKEFKFDGTSNADEIPIYLDLGEVKHMARVRLNGQDLGVVWTHPWRVDIARHWRATHPFDARTAFVWE